MRKSVLTSTLVSLPMLVGCLSIGATGLSEELTAEQQAALNSAITAIQGILDTNEAVVASVDDESEATRSKPALASQISFGVCPQVTLSSALVDGAAPSVTVDFGAGCGPGGTDELTCFGSATGSIQRNPNTISLGFDTFGCDYRTVDGMVTQSWQRGDGLIQLEGDWDLSIDPNGYPDTAVDVSGTVAFDATTIETTLETFSGSYTYDSVTWSLAGENLVISYSSNLNLIPSSGTLTIAGTSIGTLDIVFDADSPSTGEVMVSINGGPYFPWTLAIFSSSDEVTNE